MEPFRIVLRRGIKAILLAFFISGKFGQLSKNVPYIALSQAFHALAKDIFAKSDEEIKKYAEKLKKSIGDNLGLITDMIPELKSVLGQQPLLDKLGATEEELRFIVAIQKLLAVFATKEQPLVLFLDDLQWLDIQTQFG